MADHDEQIRGLKARYGEQAIDQMMRMHPDDFSQVMSWRDEMDPQYTRLNLEFSYGGLMRRGVLDDKTRLLCVVGVCIALDEMARAKTMCAPRCCSAPRSLNADFR